MSLEKCENFGRLLQWSHSFHSPAPVKVGTDDADPACVRAHGKGLEQVKSGEKTEFFIDTSNAGAGHLSVTIDGRS